MYFSPGRRTRVSSRVRRISFSNVFRVVDLPATSARPIPVGRSCRISASLEPSIKSTWSTKVLNYQPSYYYLHVHFAYLMFEAPGIYVEKAHLLSTIIRNIELMSDYYTKAVLSYVVAEGDPLYTKFLKEGVINEVSKSKTTED